MLLYVFIVPSHGEVEVVESVRKELLIPTTWNRECIYLHSILFVASDETAPDVALFIIKDILGLIPSLLNLIW